MPDRFTIDELAHETAVTARTIRAYQSQGLLPPPELRGRTGYYSPEHAARLRLIREMREDGFGLEAIKRRLQRSPGTNQEMLGFRDALRSPFEREEPVVMSEDDIVGAFGGERNGPAFQKAEQLGILVSLGAGRYEVTSPSLIRAGAQTTALGVPLEASMELLERLAEHADGAAEAFVALFLEHVWRPYEEEGEPAERWPLIQEALAQLRPLAAETLLAVFAPRMSAAVNRALRAEIRRELDEDRLGPSVQTGRKSGESS